MYRLYLVWSTKLHVGSKAMCNGKLHFRGLPPYVTDHFMHLCIYVNLCLNHHC